MVDVAMEVAERVDKDYQLITKQTAGNLTHEGEM